MTVTRTLIRRAVWLCGVWGIMLSPIAVTRAQEATTASGTPEGYVQRIPGTDVTFPMVHLPKGTFTLGSPADETGRDADEGPARTATVGSFWMSAHEVTYDAFAVFRFRRLDSDSAATPGTSFEADAVSRPSPPYEDPAHGMGKHGHPATGMTQWSALQFAKWLSEKTGRFYRLPTEAEWEYACQAGASTAYAFGDDPAALDAYAWYIGNSDEEYHPVGQKQANAWGLYDMHGNVAEWTLDQYAANFYASLPDTARNPLSEPTRRRPRTVRGGAYDDDPAALRCANRIESSLRWKRRDPQIPKSRWWNTDSPFVGFRLVRPANAPSPEEIDAFWRQHLGGS